MAKEVKFDDLRSDGRYMIRLYCSECKELMLESVELSGQEVRDSWTNLVMTAPLNAPSCPKGCPPTYSDCNQAYNMVIEEVEDGSERKAGADSESCEGDSAEGPG